MRAFVLLALAALACRPVSGGTGAGVEVSYQPSPDIHYVFGAKVNSGKGGREIYVADPAIARLPNGDYIMAHSLFGAHFKVGEMVETKIFRSTDRGATWTKTKELTGFQRGSLFAHNGAVWLIGSLVTGWTGEGSDKTATYNVAILKSTDNGVTWTTPTNANDGILIAGNTGTTKTPVVHNNRIWIALGTSWAYSAPVTSDLLKASSWKRSTPDAKKDDATLKKWPAALASDFSGTWTEAQIVASAAHGVTVMPKIQMNTPAGVPHTALFRISDDGAAMTFNPAQDFAPLTGTQKKFGATFDPVSSRYYALTNTVLAADADAVDPNSGIVKHELIRNTLTLVSSADLRHWDVEKIMLHARDAERTGWQYVTFIVDGDDLAIASRTAIKFPGDPYPAPRGHDSNRLTFHRLEDYRDAAPSHFLRIEAGTVRRYERTDYEDAPLGEFSPGLTFTAAPNALAQTADGAVYIRETGGRTHEFDAHGNLLATHAAAPGGVSFVTSGTLSITQPSAGSRSWLGTIGNDWYDPRNWFYWGRPDTSLETATFGSANTAAAGTGATTITLAESYTLAALVFRSPRPYIIAEGAIRNTESPAATYASGALEMRPATPGASALIAARQGNHAVAVPLSLPVATDIAIGAGASLAFNTDITVKAPLTLDIDLRDETAAGSPITVRNLVKISGAPPIKVTLRNATAAALTRAPLLKITGGHNLSTGDFTVGGVPENSVRLILDGNELRAIPNGISTPAGLVLDSADNIYVSDAWQRVVWKITPDRKTVFALAGRQFSMGVDNGTGDAAHFAEPAGIKILPAANGGDRLRVLDKSANSIREITADRVVTTLPPLTPALKNPAALAIDNSGNTYVADSLNRIIRKITPGGAATVVAGSGSPGDIDGIGTAAQFNVPAGIAVDADGWLYVSDALSHTIRAINPATREVKLLAGRAGEAGCADGALAAARFREPRGLVIDGLLCSGARDGSLYVADSGNSLIREITRDSVRTIAGHPGDDTEAPVIPGVPGFKDGTGTSAWFNYPMDIALAKNGDLYVADTDNSAIRKITFDRSNNAIVTTLAPASGTAPAAGGGDGGGSGGGGGGSGGGGGGGASSIVFFISLFVLAAIRAGRTASGEKARH